MKERKERKRKEREEGENANGEERPAKKPRLVEALTPEIEKVVLTTAHGATAVDRVSTELALKFTTLSKKKAAQLIKEHCAYEKREGGGLRKRYYLKPEAATRWGIETSTLDAALKSVLDREAQEAQEARQLALQQAQLHAQQMQAQQLALQAQSDLQVLNFATPPPPQPRRVVPVALPPAPSPIAMMPPNNMQAMFVQHTLPSQSATLPTPPPAPTHFQPQPLPQPQAPVQPTPTRITATPLSPPERKVAPITQFFVPTSKTAPDA